MKFLGVSALLATVALADLGIVWTNDIPVDGNYTIGTDFALKWKSFDAKPTDTFQLTLSAWNKTVKGYFTGPFGEQVPEFDSLDIVLDKAVKFSDGVYHWPIKPIDDKGIWKNSGFYYSFSAEFETTSDSPRAFHITD